MNIERYFGPETLHPAIPAMGWSSQTQARPGLKGHQHPYYEFVFLERGEVEWFSGRKLYSLSAPCVFLASPEIAHGSATGVIQPSVFGWIQIDANMLSKEFKELISKLNWTQTSLSPQLLSTFKGILTEVREPFANSTTMIHGLLTQALILLSRIAESEPSLIHSEPIQRVLDAVKRNPGHPWTSEELEKVAGLRHSQLHEIFRKEVGHSPRAYALGYRLREANRLLRESTLSITSLAHDLGFSSSQHLSSAFRKYFGITPSQCRQDKGF